MYEALTLLEELLDPDIEWFFDVGAERQVIANASVIRENQPIDGLTIVLQGLLGVSSSAFGPRRLATLGPGEICGDMSILEDRPASASVDAVENSLLLVVPRDALCARLDEDPAFASRFYRAMAIMNARRLRERVDTLGTLVSERGQTALAEHAQSAELERLVSDFKQTIVEADEQALKHDGRVPGPLGDKIRTAFPAMCAKVNELIGDAAPLPDEVKWAMGRRVREEMLPYLLLTRTAERFYSKPRGYAGDFMTIQMIYDNEPGGTGRIGPLLDECFLRAPAAAGVRNRRVVLAEEIWMTLQSKPEWPARITSLASGPAAELFDVFGGLKDKARLKATCIDIDLQALAFVSEKRDRLKLQDHMDLVTGNLVYLATGRQRLDLKDQDLVYSVGFIDYFNDKFVVSLLNYVHGILAPGGRVVLGNFHPANPNKALMDHLLDWRLIHRSEEDLNRLYASSLFGRPCTRIRAEEEGINLFAECVKA
jgi:CRP-like cAMP-binding protein/SAM-dependent methyltransferase